MDRDISTFQYTLNSVLVSKLYGALGDVIAIGSRLVKHACCTCICIGG